MQRWTGRVGPRAGRCSRSHGGHGRAHSPPPVRPVASPCVRWGVRGAPDVAPKPGNAPASTPASPWAYLVDGQITKHNSN
jgi:hypothetical protein